MLFNLSGAELVGFPSAARHLKTHSTTYVKISNPVSGFVSKPGNTFYSLQGNSNAFA